MIGCPLNLDILLHCHVSTGPYPHPSPPADDGLAYLLQVGMIEYGEGPNIYRSTARGAAYIDYLMQVPFPEQHWIVPGTVLEGSL